MKLLAAVSALFMTASAQATGVCYSPFHAEKYFSEPAKIEKVLLEDMAQIASSTGFSAVRTYHAQFYGQNVIDAVVANNLQVAIGIQMVGINGASYTYLNDDIQAAISAAKTHPESVLAIYAGNENLINGDFGSSSADEIIKVITTVKSALKGTKGANIPVGTAQRLEEWLHATDADRVAAACDVVGVNIYPFFTKGGESDMLGSLDAQWTQMTAKYGASKARLTETGWPSQGSISDAGNTPSLANAQKYYAAFTQWAQKHASSPFYFMMYDLLKAHATDYEQHFGVSTATGALKFSLSSSASASQSQASSSQSQASTTPAAAASASTPSSSRTEDAGNADSEVAGEADRSANSVTTTTTAPTIASATPAPSPTVIVSSAIGNAISSTSSSGSISATTTNSSTSSVSTPATSAPSPAVEISNSTMASTTSSNSTANSGSSVTKAPDSLPSVDEAGGVANGSGPSDVDDMGFGSSSSSFNGSIGNSSGSSSSSAGANNGPDVGDVDNNAPVSAPDLTPQTVAPVPSTTPSASSSSSASKVLETQEAQAKRAREVSGKQGWSVQALTAAIGCAGIAAIAVIAVYVQKRRNEESENQVSITTADVRDSTPSVYSDPLGTRFSSIVMITPNGDGVCIL